MSWPVRYWTSAAREQNQWAMQMRAAARKAIRVRESGQLYDAARNCRFRRDVFMAEARKMRAELARIGSAP